MSFVLIAIAIVELLCMFGVFQGIADVKQYKLALFFSCSETIPSLLIALYLSTSITSEEPGDHYQAVSHAQLGKESDSEDSEFGSFNPNLHNTDRKSDSNLSRSLNQIRTPVELKKPLFPLNMMKLSDLSDNSKV
jgi:hypothetical protein